MKTEEQQVKQERFRIKPDTLDAFISTCDDDELCGRILRALGGQDVELKDRAERYLYLTIKGDVDKMNKSYEAKKAKWRISKEQWRKKADEAMKMIDKGKEDKE